MASTVDEACERTVPTYAQLTQVGTTDLANGKFRWRMRSMKITRIVGTSTRLLLLLRATEAPSNVQ